MKKILKHFLWRHPSLYWRILWASGVGGKREKITYLRLLRKGDTVFEIGANRGDFTVLFSNVVGATGSLHAFEPVPPTFAALYERLKAECSFDNIKLNNLAMGDTEGVFQIHVPAGDFGQASLRSHTDSSWSKPGRESYDCTVRTLDSYVAQNNLDRLDLIKIDVEGAELLVLQGGQQTLDRFHPVIHFECFAPWSAAFDYTPADLVSFLLSRGYLHFYSGDLLPLASPETVVGTDEANQNFVCSSRPL